MSETAARQPNTAANAAGAIAIVALVLTFVPYGVAFGGG